MFLKTMRSRVRKFLGKDVGDLNHARVEREPQTREGGCKVTEAMWRSAVDLGHGGPVMREY